MSDYKLIYVNSIKNVHLIEVGSILAMDSIAGIVAPSLKHSNFVRLFGFAVQALRSPPLYFRTSFQRRRFSISHHIERILLGKDPVGSSDDRFL
jgi:hypothetical protein